MTSADVNRSEGVFFPVPCPAEAGDLETTAATVEPVATVAPETEPVNIAKARRIGGTRVMPLMRSRFYAKKPSPSPLYFLRT